MIKLVVILFIIKLYARNNIFKKLFDLKKMYNVEVFRLRSGVEKHFLLKVFLYKKKNYQKKRLKPFEKIRKAVENIYSLPSKKYRIKPEELEQKSLGSEAYREKFDFRRLENSQKNTTG